ncbi:MAG: nucleotidyltransferase domain-containing protein [Rhodococcus sp. (in: high G+C Gram-positive bacteria)]|uniref:nucleotidyltransferase family protein n=1 Tax=Rhodococcus sp. TaxID=1831 RepID=UPI003BB4E603
MAQVVSTLALPIPLGELREILRRHGVVEAYVFGSYARGTARPDSDLDLLMVFGADADPWEFLYLQEELNQLLPGGADVVTKLNKHFEPYIKPDLVKVA